MSRCGRFLAAACFFHLREVGPSRLKLKGAVGRSASRARHRHTDIANSLKRSMISGRQKHHTSPHAARAPPRPGARRALLLFRDRAAQGDARQRPCPGTEQGRGPIAKALPTNGVIATRRWSTCSGCRSIPGAAQPIAVIPGARAFARIRKSRPRCRCKTAQRIVRPARAVWISGFAAERPLRNDTPCSLQLQFHELHPHPLIVHDLRIALRIRPRGTA